MTLVGYKKCIVSVLYFAIDKNQLFRDQIVFFKII